MAQASSMPTESRMRKPFGSRIIMSATSVPTNIVMTTHAAEKTSVRASTAQNTGSVRTFA